MTIFNNNNIIILAKHAVSIAILVLYTPGTQLMYLSLFSDVTLA